MKDTILFLVHVEEMFRQHFPDRMYVNRLLSAIKRADEVYVMVSEIENYEPIQEIHHCYYPYIKISWGWGYEKDQDLGQGEEKWIIPTDSPHQYTWVPPELRKMKKKLQKNNVIIGGGYDGECLLDFEDCLKFLDVPYRKISGYVYP